MIFIINEMIIIVTAKETDDIAPSFSINLHQSADGCHFHSRISCNLEKSILRDVVRRNSFYILWNISKLICDSVMATVSYINLIYFTVFFCDVRIS